MSYDIRPNDYVNKTTFNLHKNISLDNKPLKHYSFVRIVDFGIN
jgi:hypothetical protein